MECSVCGRWKTSGELKPLTLSDDGVSDPRTIHDVCSECRDYIQPDGPVAIEKETANPPDACPAHLRAKESPAIAAGLLNASGKATFT